VLGLEAHGLAIATVECKGDADLLAIVAADLEPVRAPGGVAGIDGDAAIVTTLLATPAVPLEQQPMQLHDAIDAFGIGCCAPVFFRLAAEQRVDAAIAVGRQLED